MDGWMDGWMEGLGGVNRGSERSEIVTSFLSLFSYTDDIAISFVTFG